MGGSAQGWYFGFKGRSEEIPENALQGRQRLRKTPECKAIRSLTHLAAGDKKLPPVNPGRLFAVHAYVETVEKRFRCPCCGNRTLQTPDALALCPVCWWEDDGQEDRDAGDVRLTVNGQLSLDQAREFYSQIGAAHPRFVPYVRKALATEE